MNKEIEIKAKLKSYSATKNILQKKCKYVKTMNQVDEYWTPAHKDIYSMKPRNYWRIRCENKNNKVSLDYHIPVRNKGKQHHTAEYETEVADGKTLKKILQLIDAKHILTIKKNREYYSYKGFEICLDKVAGLGAFLEIEAKKIYKTELKTLDRCYELLDELNIECLDRKSKNYFKLGFRKLSNKKQNKK